MLSLHTSGENAGKAQVGAANTKILGKFLSLDKDKVASYLATGTPMILRKTAASITVGDRVVSAGSGKVKTEPDSGAGSDSGRGLVIEILETGDNGRVKVLMPA